MSDQVKADPEVKEVYIGSITQPDGSGYHIFLLPGDKGDGNWQDAMDWAKEKGGDLPNRVEQALMFAHSRDQFKKDWYWSNTTHEKDSEWAWFQRFNDGSQSSNRKSSGNCRARAVRRLPI
jgi:hypothetical protein